MSDATYPEADKEKMPDQMVRWVQFAKNQKMWAVDKFHRGDIPPTCIVERDGEILAVVIAPDVDKHQGLQCAAMCHAGFDPDAMIMVLDAHMASHEKKEGQTAEEAQAEMAKLYPPGSMQKMCDEEGACELPDPKITDCLICHRIDRQGNISLVTLPYAYHGKDGPPLKWLDEDPKWKGHFGEDRADDPKSGVKLLGLIPETLRDIMQQPSILEQVPYLKKQAMENFDFTPERARYHTARAVMHMLAEKRFFVVDYVTSKHPEWTDCKEKAKHLVGLMIGDKGFIPKESQPVLNELIDQYMGTPEFKDKLIECMKKNSYWLPPDGREDIYGFAILFESACMAPNLPSIDPEEKTPADKAAEGEPQRVRVWNGDKSEFLGEGKYVGNVRVYFIRMPDGSLQSNHNAEIEPDPASVPEGAKVISAANNPKIIMDNGDTVYGCQVWWEPVEEAPKHKYNKAK